MSKKKYKIKQDKIDKLKIYLTKLEKDGRHRIK